jgi:hypothetical protein
MTADRAVTAALEALAGALAELQAPAMVIGGIAAIARGVARTTLDIDATIWAEPLDLRRALEIFVRHGFRPRVDDPLSFGEEHQVLLLEHGASGTPLDLPLARLPFERSAIERASVVDFGGPRLPVVSAEDLIVYKAVAWRTRDREDIERLLSIHGADADLARVRALIAEFCAVLDDSERLVEFDRMVRASGGIRRV